ncbi:MAG: UDP-glucose/GDP-mannose dehydrogenase family protein [Candidatus Eisenbacteria bacterium]|nr:UDP-glucose/GDP-mannose dehydrogenase family protein [Candidatus Eisenbacteria bacterium]
MKKICVVGTGYVGLVTGTCLADFGNRVLCVDVDEEKIRLLRMGQVPFYEPGLEEMVRRNISGGRLLFTRSIEEGVRDSEVLFIAVGTPSDDAGNADLTYVNEVAAEIGRSMNGYKVIVTKSTVPTGTGALVAEIVRGNQTAKHEFDVVSNPEFLREGSAIQDFMRPDRIIVGTDSPRAAEIISEVYEPLYLLDTPIVKTSVATAEMIKYASNAFLATKISFINEIASVCERVGADVNTVAIGMGLDGRIGPKFLHAGAGFGGSCFPKDTRALIQIAEKAGVEPLITRAVVEVNERRRAEMAAKVRRAAGGSLAGKRIGVLGLAFKPNTDDVRESPALDVIRILRGEGADVRAFDPVAGPNAKKEIPDLALTGSVLGTAEGADVLVVMTEWNEFRELDFAGIRSAMAKPVLVDCRNVYEPRKVRDAGFEYFSVGRP